MTNQHPPLSELLPCEIWKAIPFAPQYEVSNLGNVRNTKRSNRLLRPYLSERGYMRVFLKRKNFFVHRLVAEAFIDKTGEVVNHKDGNQLNNHAYNLEWCTQKHNVNHAISIGRTCCNKLSPENAIEICQLSTSMRTAHIAKKFNVDPRTVAEIIKGVSHVYATREIREQLRQGAQS